MKHAGISECGDAGAVIGAGVAVQSALHERVDFPHFRFHMEHWAPREENRERAVALREERDAAAAAGYDARAAELDEAYQALLVKVWEDDFVNQITTVGKNDLLDKYFAGSGYTAAWYMGLVDVDSFTSYNANDTMASHGGWVESTEYSNANRPDITFSGASGGSKAISGTIDFNINATTGIQGAFIVTNSTKGGTTGTLYSAGTFSGGARTGLQSGDTLKVSGSWGV